MAAARFITFEGGEGSGKSTQARLLSQRLREAGIDCLVTREPGGSPFAEEVRALVLDPGAAAHGALAEALLFYAARADHLETLIRPALAQGRWVICDRFSDSTRVYQGLAGGVPDPVLDQLEAIVVNPTVPDLTLVLDVPPDVGLARARGRRKANRADAYEQRDLAYHERLREGYRRLATLNPGRCLILDAVRTEEAIAADVWARVLSLRAL